MDAISHQTVETGTLIDLVKVRQGLAAANDAPLGIFCRWSVGVIEQTLGEIGSGEEILEPLLVLDADGVAAEFIGDAQGRDVGATLRENLGLGELGFFVGAEMELHALGEKPMVDRAALLLRDLGGGVVERGLGQAFLVDAGGEEQLVRNDGVIHAHAALVEDPHDRFVGAEFFGQSLGDTEGAGRHFRLGQFLHMVGRVGDAAFSQPALQSGEEKFVGKVERPKGGVFDACFGEGAVQI